MLNQKNQIFFHFFGSSLTGMVFGHKDCPKPLNVDPEPPDTQSSDIYIAYTEGTVPHWRLETSFSAMSHAVTACRLQSCQN